LIGQPYWDAYSTIAVLQSASEPTDIESAIVDAGIVGSTFRDDVESMIRPRLQRTKHGQVRVL
jgi:hypothetical protein